MSTYTKIQTIVARILAINRIILFMRYLQIGKKTIYYTLSCLILLDYLYIHIFYIEFQFNYI